MTARNCYSMSAGFSKSLAAAAAALLAAALMVAAVPALAGDEEAGRILFARGEAGLIRDTVHHEVRRGDRLYVGDTVVTGESGRLQIRFIDEGMVSLRANTELHIEAFEYDPESGEGGSVSRLMEGAMRAVTGRIAANDPGSYTVETPVATIGVRGTDFEPLHVPEGREGDYGDAPAGTYSRTHEGLGVIASAGGELDVGPGQTGFVDDPQAPPALVPEPAFFRQTEDTADDEEEEDDDEEEEAEEDEADEEEAEDDEAEDEAEAEDDGADDEAAAEEPVDDAADDDFREESAFDDGFDDDGLIDDGLTDDFGDDFDDDPLDDVTEAVTDDPVEDVVVDDPDQLIIEIR